MRLIKTIILRCFLLLFFACFSLHAAKSTLPFIQGISGKVLTNVEKRLEEWQQLKPLNETTPEELRTQIIAALQPFGYFKPVVTIQKQNDKTLVYISPGPQTQITAINLQMVGEGANNLQLLETLHTLPLHEGAPLLIEDYNKAKQSLINTAENLGYLQASFPKAEIDVTNQNTANISLTFNTGPLFYFGQVQFNPTNINSALLHRFIPFQYHTPYSTEQIVKFNNALSNSGYFSSVLVKPQIGDTKTVPINVHLEPTPKYSYSLGAGYGTDTGARGRAGLYVVPVNPKGHKFSALAQGSFNQNAIQAQYLIPGQNPIQDQYSLTGNLSNLSYSSGYGNAYLLSLAQQHRINHYHRILSINGLYESFNYQQQPNSYQFMIYPKAKFAFTQTSNPLFSPSGYNLTLSVMGASKAAGSTTSFAQSSLDAKGAYMIEPVRLRLYAHAMTGVTAINNINNLPLSLALLLGGTDNLKAFSFNSIGPGRNVGYGGIELQKETFKHWYLIGFYDAGYVYNPVPKNTLYDIGAALMWVSPVGPIKLGLAQQINKQLGRISTNPRLVISMGPDL